MKRQIFSRGYAAPIHHFLKGIDTPETFHPTDGRFVVNLSFDLELALNTPFWNSSFDEALHWGKKAVEYMPDILSYCKQEKVPINVQIAGALLENGTRDLPLEDAHRSIIQNNESLFRLDEYVPALTSPRIEIGVHGFSHRRFAELSEHEAHDEIQKTLAILTKTFGTRPRFMSFPKNNVEHTNILKKHGITMWRTNTQTIHEKGEVPLGLWLAPGILSPRDLTRLLAEIRRRRPQGFFLHLWGHFTESSPNVFKEQIEAIQAENWSFTTASSYLNL